MSLKKSLIIVGIAGLMLTGCSEKIEKAVDKGTETLDKVQEVDAKVSNTVSSISPKVQLVKNAEYEYEGKKFTLKELFDAVLDHPKWETDEIEGVKVVMVSGGFKDKIFSEDFKGFVHEKAMVDILEETARISFVFPFYEGQFLPDEEIGFFYEVGGEKMGGDIGPQILDQLIQIYASEIDKK